MPKHRNGGLRKRCRCKRKDWAKCAHSWYLNFKPRGGQHCRLSLDAELGRRVTSKTEAAEEATRIKAEILAGTFVRAADRRKAIAPEPATADAVTLRSFSQLYLERHAMACGKKTWKNDAGMLNQLSAFKVPGPDGVRPFGDKPLGAVTEDDIEAFFADLRRQGRAASTRNKYLQLCKMMFRWAVKKGYLARSPIADAETLKREKMVRRNRRLIPDVLDGDGKVKELGEEQRLLAAMGPGLQRLVIAALETGCRKGELLTLRWADVNLEHRELRAHSTHRDQSVHAIVITRTRAS